LVLRGIISKIKLMHRIKIAIDNINKEGAYNIRKGDKDNR